MSTGIDSAPGAPQTDALPQARLAQLLHRRDSIFESVSYAVGRFLEGASWEDAIEDVLTRLGEASNVSRAYVFENEANGDGDWCMTERFEWTAPGVRSTLDDPENRLWPYRDGFGRWERELGAGRIIAGLVSEAPESERSDMESEGVLSCATVPVFVGGQWWGFIGFDDCETLRVWTDLELEALRVAANTLGSAIARGRIIRDMEEAERRYRTLVEQVPAIVYIDVVNDEMTTSYVSPQIRELLGVEPHEYEQNPNLWEEMLHPDDRGRALAEYLAGRAHPGTFSFEYRMIARDGQIKWFRDSAAVVPAEFGRPALVQGMMLDITERKTAEEQLTHLAYHDKLTALPNRAFFEELLDVALARARRRDLGVGVLYLDLDNFKLVNDSLGHQAGDVLLVQLADRLRACMRDTDVVARQGGDEFLILLSDLERGPGVVPGTEAAVLVAEFVAERVHEALAEPFDLNGVEFYATASVGVSLFPHDAFDAESLFRNADAAMYQSKKYEPGSYVIYSAHEEEDTTDRLAFSTRLRHAVDARDWVLHYQPIVDLGDGHVTGVEALIRWQEPNGGIVPPGEFIPLAEELGLIEAIGDWVIDEMAKQQMLWAEQGLDLQTSFNLSPRQLWSPHLAEKILGKLSLAGVDPHKVVVEITESTAMADPDRTQKILAELHAWGLTLAIDDFGTGYSSLARLKHMPVDILKIDRAFVRDVDKDIGLAGMVRAMIQLAQSLNMTPLAEGIETHGEYVFLRSNGCRLAQGFHFAKPVPAEDIPALVARKGGLIPEQLARGL
jgi:diguanylate cyclase (GGDEF)-like protein/PAS domain S-box-containing protein